MDLNKIDEEFKKEFQVYCFTNGITISQDFVSCSVNKLMSFFIPKLEEAYDKGKEDNQIKILKNEIINEIEKEIYNQTLEEVEKKIEERLSKITQKLLSVELSIGGESQLWVKRVELEKLLQTIKEMKK